MRTARPPGWRGLMRSKAHASSAATRSTTPRAATCCNGSTARPRRARRSRPPSPARSTAPSAPASSASSRRASRSPLPAAPADLRDDDAVVELALAGAHARFQHVAVDLEQRQRLAHLLRLVEHQVHVLEVLTRTALGAKIALDHLAALGVHHLRIGR